MENNKPKKQEKDKSWIEHTRKFNESIKWGEMFKYCEEIYQERIYRKNLSIGLEMYNPLV